MHSGDVEYAFTNDGQQRQKTTHHIYTTHSVLTQSKQSHRNLGEFGVIAMNVFICCHTHTHSMYACQMQFLALLFFSVVCTTHYHGVCKIWWQPTSNFLVDDCKGNSLACGLVVFSCGCQKCVFALVRRDSERSANTRAARRWPLTRLFFFFGLSHDSTSYRNFSECQMQFK